MIKRSYIWCQTSETDNDILVVDGNLISSDDSSTREIAVDLMFRIHKRGTRLSVDQSGPTIRKYKKFYLLEYLSKKMDSHQRKLPLTLILEVGKGKDSSGSDTLTRSLEVVEDWIDLKFPSTLLSVMIDLTEKYRRRTIFFASLVLILLITCFLIIVI